MSDPEPYVRFEDMSVDGKLILIIQEDGDVIVNIRPSREVLDREGGSPFGLTAEFCTHAGGGQSKHTLIALKQLANAIEMDNKLTPQSREK